MLLAGEQTLSLGFSHLTTSLGDQGVFLAREEAPMRWFLLASDLTALEDRTTAPPFQPRLYPHPPSCSPEQTAPCPVEEGVKGVCPPDSDPTARGANPTPKEKKDGVRFHSPPKTIFKPTVQVCTR